MSSGFLPPVVVELVASAKEFYATKNEVVHGVREIGREGELTSAKLANLGRKISTGFLFGIAGALAVGLKSAIEYEHAIEQIGIIAGVSGKELEYLKTTVIDVSNATSTANTDIAGAYQLVEQAGFRGAKATEIVTAAAKAAKVTHSDLNETVKALIVTQNLHIKGTENAAATTGYLVESLAHGTKTFSDTSALLSGKVALAFKTYGIDISSAISASDIFSKAQIKGTKASLGLAGVIEKLEKPSDSTGKVLKSIGLTQAQIADELRKPNGLIHVFEMLQGGFNKFATAADKQRGSGAFFSQLFGGRTAAAAQALLAFAPEFAKGLGGSAEAAALLAEKFKEWQTQTTEGKLAKFKTSLQNFETKLGENLLPAASKVLDWINRFADKIRDDKSFRNNIKHAFEVGIGLALGVKLLPIVNKIRGAFKATEVAGNTGAVTGNTGATNLNTDALIALRTAMIEGGLIKGAAGTGAAGAAGAGAAGAEAAVGISAAAVPVIAAAGFAAFMLMGYKLTHDKLTKEQMNDPRSRWTGGEFGAQIPKKTSTKHTVKVKVVP